MWKDLGLTSGVSELATESTESTDPHPSPRTLVPPTPPNLIDDAPAKCSRRDGWGKQSFGVWGRASVDSVGSVAISRPNYSTGASATTPLRRLVTTQVPITITNPITRNGTTNASSRVTPCGLWPRNPRKPRTPALPHGPWLPQPHPTTTKKRLPLDRTGVGSGENSHSGWGEGFPWVPWVPWPFKLGT